jgi:4-diphosphocytidyl-2-C-methyl-D-erythritol kinase
MNALIVPAPAKLNLFLHVVGRRADGYHELESVMCLLGFGDTLALQARDDGVIRRLNEVEGVSPGDDLCVRAATLLQRATGVRRGVDITLRKQTPLGAGLGGGSSDAASVLLALNRLWDLRLPRSRLQELALNLGADVPFFVFGVPALARGVGDLLDPVTLPRLCAVIAVPPVQVPTADIFAAAELTRDTGRVSFGAFALEFGRNDLQAAACARYPAIAACVDALELGLDGSGARPGIARMTGSGAASFRLLPPGSDLLNPGWRERLMGLAPPGTRCFAARLLARHPLYEYAETL